MLSGFFYIKKGQAREPDLNVSAIIEARKCGTDN